MNVDELIAEIHRNPAKSGYAALLDTVVTPAQAESRQAVPVSGPYTLGNEDWMLLRALDDYKRADRLDIVLLVYETTYVRHRKETGISIWRLATHP